MGGFEFGIGLEVTLFLFAVWASGRLFQMVLKLPPILGYLAVGILFGPRVLDMVPYASNGLCDSYANPQDDFVSGSGSDWAISGSGSGRRLAGSGSGSGGSVCTNVPWARLDGEGKYISNIWTFIGNVGVTLMIMESGMHIHFDKVVLVGKKALVVAIVGTSLPIIMGIIAVGALYSNEGSNSWYPWGVSAGCAFAPTSVGISIKLLDESKMLNSMAGQTTLIAAFIDDVFSLVTLVILQTLATGDITPQGIIVPLCSSFAFLGIGVLLAIYAFPKIPKLILSRIPLKKNVSIQPRDEVRCWLACIDPSSRGMRSAASLHA